MYSQKNNLGAKVSNIRSSGSKILTAKMIAIRIKFVYSQHDNQIGKTK